MLSRETVFPTPFPSHWLEWSPGPWSQKNPQPGHIRVDNHGKPVIFERSSGIPPDGKPHKGGDDVRSIFEDAVFCLQRLTMLGSSNPAVTKPTLSKAGWMYAFLGVSILANAEVSPFWLPVVYGYKFRERRVEERCRFAGPRGPVWDNPLDSLTNRFGGLREPRMGHLLELSTGIGAKQMPLLRLAV